MAQLAHIGKEAFVPVFIGDLQYELLVSRLIFRPDRAQQDMALIFKPSTFFQLGRIGADRQSVAGRDGGVSQREAGIQHHHFGTARLQRVQIQLLNLRKGEQ